MSQSLISKIDDPNATSKEVMDAIFALEDRLKDLPQLEIEIVHHYSKAVYAREMKMSAGTLVIGKIHKFENLNILSKGKVTVASIDGVMRIEAPYTFVASPGTKRVIYAHEDSVWTTIHGTEERDLAKIEAEFISSRPLLAEAGEKPTQILEVTKCHG